MKIKFSKILSLLVVLTTGCSSHQVNIGHAERFEQHGMAFIYSPADSFNIRSYYAIYSSFPRKNETNNKPNDFLQQVSWYTKNRHDTDTPFDQETHQLHIKKITNKDKTYVIEGYAVYINDSGYTYYSWSDPADSIHILTILGKSTTFISHIDPPPYQLTQVIDTLLRYYPEYVTVIDDTLEHSFNNVEANYEKNYPHITIN